MNARPWVQDSLILLVLALNVAAGVILVIDFDNWGTALVFVFMAVSLAIIEHGMSPRT